jgi:glycosyltransferase involved in cell wall biosynthesis
MSRPAVDVVVPFAGSIQALHGLASRLVRLKLGSADSALIVDNTPTRDRGEREAVNGVSVIHAPERSTPGFARNRGAAVGSAPWIVFFDADTEPSEDLLDRYFDPAPEPLTALIAGGVRDEPVPKDGLPAARYAYIREAMSQENTFRFGAWSYPTTSNVAVRRAAFEGVGGFREDIRAAEDADLTYRLKRAGWEVERRETADVMHESRSTLWSFVVQKAVHGAGGAWLNRQYPGCLPARRRPGLTWWALRTAARGLTGAIQSRDRDQALWAVFYPLELLVWELGRSLPNERPLTPRVWRQALRNLTPGPGTPRI